MADPNDFTDQFNTQLSPEQEAQFRQAYPNPGDSYDYDMRGAWLAGAAKAGNGHYPDTFKKPNHPTFSDQSKYNAGEYRGGKWVSMPDGTFLFMAGPTNMKFFSPEDLQAYFRKVEPGNKLTLPQVPIPAVEAAFGR